MGEIVAISGPPAASAFGTFIDAGVSWSPTYHNSISIRMQCTRSHGRDLGLPVRRRIRTGNSNDVVFDDFPMFRMILSLGTRFREL